MKGVYIIVHIKPLSCEYQVSVAEIQYVPFNIKVVIVRASHLFHLLIAGVSIFTFIVLLR